MLDVNDPYILVIAALLPLTAAMVVTQTNPYHALVMRGILGAVAALVYALFGAADVALTEALVGALLSVTLYAIAVRSSMSFRLGVLVPDSEVVPAATEARWQQLLTAIRQPLHRCHLRLEQVAYPSPAALSTALEKKEVHGICWPSPAANEPYQLQLRVPRLNEILSGHLPAELVSMSLIEPSHDRPAPVLPASASINSVEGQ